MAFCFIGDFVRLASHLIIIGQRNIFLVDEQLSLALSIQGLRDYSGNLNEP